MVTFLLVTPCLWFFVIARQKPGSDDSLCKASSHPRDGTHVHSDQERAGWHRSTENNQHKYIYSIYSQGRCYNLPLTSNSTYISVYIRRIINKIRSDMIIYFNYYKMIQKIISSVFWVQDRASCSVDMAEHLSRCYLPHNGSSPHGKSCPGILQCSYRCRLLWEWSAAYRRYTGVRIFFTDQNTTNGYILHSQHHFFCGI